MIPSTRTRMARAMELREELFDLANSFAGDVTGEVAVQLHTACNYIVWAENTLDDIDPIT